MIGAGARGSCGSWLEGRKNRQFFYMANWALGYISGAAIWGNIGDPLGHTDADGVLYWLDNYCSSNPTTEFSDAVDAFIMNSIGR